MKTKFKPNIARGARGCGSRPRAPDARKDRTSEEQRSNQNPPDSQQDSTVADKTSQGT